jgi:hypothetical protein
VADAPSHPAAGGLGAEGEEDLMRRSNNSRWNPEDDQQLLDLMDAEASWPLIAITLNRSVQAVQRRN